MWWGQVWSSQLKHGEKVRPFLKSHLLGSLWSTASSEEYRKKENKTKQISVGRLEIQFLDDLGCSTLRREQELRKSCPETTCRYGPGSGSCRLCQVQRIEWTGNEIFVMVALKYLCVEFHCSSMDCLPSMPTAQLSRALLLWSFWERSLFLLC